MRRLLNQAANAAAKAKEASSRLCIAAQSRAWDTTKPSEPSPIDSIDGSGGSCTRESVTKNGAQPSPNDRSNSTWKMLRQLRRLGYRIEPPNPQPSQAQAQGFFDPVNRVTRSTSPGTTPDLSAAVKIMFSEADEIAQLSVRVGRYPQALDTMDQVASEVVFVEFVEVEIGNRAK